MSCFISWKQAVFSDVFCAAFRTPPISGARDVQATKFDRGLIPPIFRSPFARMMRGETKLADRQGRPRGLWLAGEKRGWTGVHDDEAGRADRRGFGFATA